MSGRRGKNQTTSPLVKMHFQKDTRLNVTNCSGFKPLHYYVCHSLGAALDLQLQGPLPPPFFSITFIFEMVSKLHFKFLRIIILMPTARNYHFTVSNLHFFPEPQIPSRLHTFDTNSFELCPYRSSPSPLL